MSDRRREYRREAVSLEVTIKKCVQGRQWSAALHLLREGIRLGVELFEGHYMVNVGAYRQRGQWQLALSLL
eukprot:5500777-Pyramimonas_sp.AAC.1